MNIKNLNYIYNQDIRSKLIDNLKQKRKNSKSMLIKHMSSTARIISFNDKEMKVKLYVRKGDLY